MTAADQNPYESEQAGDENPYRAPRELSGPPAKDVTARQPPRLLTRLLWIGVAIFFAGFLLAFLPIQSMLFVAPVLLLIIGGCLLVISSCLVRMVLAISRWF
jgi:hypothetical protein